MLLITLTWPLKKHLFSPIHADVTLAPLWTWACLHEIASKIQSQFTLIWFGHCQLFWCYCCMHLVLLIHCSKGVISLIVNERHVYSYKWMRFWFRSLQTGKTVCKWMDESGTYDVLAAFSQQKLAQWIHIHTKASA